MEYERERTVELDEKGQPVSGDWICDKVTIHRVVIRRQFKNVLLSKYGYVETSLSRA